MILETRQQQARLRRGGCLPNAGNAHKEITLRHAKVNELLGIELRPEKMEYYLGQLGLKTWAARRVPWTPKARPSRLPSAFPPFAWI